MADAFATEAFFRCLFDYQSFEHNGKLDAMISAVKNLCDSINPVTELSDDALQEISAAGDADSAHLSRLRQPKPDEEDS